MARDNGDATINSGFGSSFSTNTCANCAPAMPAFDSFVSYKRGSLNFSSAQWLEARYSFISVFPCRTRMTVFSFVLLLFLLSASIPLVVRTNVVALLIFLPILRCFLLNVNNTFEDDGENDDGVGVDVAIQQKKSL